MEGVRTAIRPPKHPAWEDCSSFATWCYWAAGAPDPNGLDYNGFGLHGHAGAARQDHASSRGPATSSFYGGGVRSRRTSPVYVGNGKVVSHGSEPGPYLLGIDYRSDRSQVASYVS